jgi:dihydrofolate synthase / folylpolyglutamate synthase
MTYKETLDFLYSQLPAYTRIGAAAYKADLDNIKRLCSALGNPEKGLKVVHVAGTNGKGSSSHYLASILQEAAYRTGLFTSPHLKDFRERFRVNGKMMPQKFVVTFVENNKTLFEEIKPSFFEMTVALAFEWFKQQKVDIAVIETGLGGRLDSTNVVMPEISLITNIDFDHTDLLGDTIEKIAIEKAGIIKHKRPVIVSEFKQESAIVFRKKAEEMGSDVFFGSEEINWDQSELKVHSGNVHLFLKGRYQSDSLEIFSPLIGGYQKQNLKGVWLSVLKLKKFGWKIPDEAIILGVEHVIKNTHLMGRWQQMAAKPDVFCDTGHNTAGIKEVLNQIQHHPHNHLRIVFGMVKDKAIENVLDLLPQNASYYFCKANLFRAIDANELKEKAAKFGLIGKSYKSVKLALNAAKKASSEDDLIIVGGSTFVVAEVL